MIIVRVCLGSSCFLKGSKELVEMLEKEISDNHLENEITLVGSFCFGKCNRVGVTIEVDDEVYTGITPQDFKAFWQDKILKKISK